MSKQDACGRHKMSKNVENEKKLIMAPKWVYQVTQATQLEQEGISDPLLTVKITSVMSFMIITRTYSTVNSLITHTPSGEALRYGLLGSMGYQGVLKWALKWVTQVVMQVRNLANHLHIFIF